MKKVMFNDNQLSGSFGQENLPIGSIIAYGGVNPPIGFLLCNGSNVSRTLYADLFNAIGTAYGEGNGTTTFTLPDLRESVLVGAGQNTTKTIAEHDVYNVGEFKDDQLQGHIHHSQANIDYNTGSQSASAMYAHALRNNWNAMNDTARQTYLTDNAHGTPRIGSTTHGKQTGCHYIIKYCKSVTPAQEAIIDDNNISGTTTFSSTKITTQNTYSTEETDTGKTWIDGKKIYRKVVTGLNYLNSSSSWTNLGYTDTNVDTLVDFVFRRSSDKTVIKQGALKCLNNGVFQYWVIEGFDGTNILEYEYTKTTD